MEMANPVFEGALAAITQAMASIEAEVRRLNALDMQAKGVQQHLDAMRVQETELQKTVNDLAAQIPAHRQTIAGASMTATRVAVEGEQEKARIIAEGKRQHREILDQAHRDAQAILSKAQQEAASYHDRIAAGKAQLAAIEADKNAHIERLDAAKNAFTQMKQHAATFAALGDIKSLIGS